MVLDKQTILQIFGSIMQRPSLLAEVDNYNLNPTDFEIPFEKYVFASLANLAQNGIEKINVVDIDNYLATKPNIYEIFNKHNGIEYLQDAEDIAQVENFQYYYNKLKKYNAIRDLAKLGFDTQRIYPEGDILDDNDFKKREMFENMSVADIFNAVKAPLAAAEINYGCSAAESCSADQNIRELIDKLKTIPEIGAPCQGDILNTVVRGGRKGKFYMFSAMSGGSKTRSMIGHACYMAYPIRYDSMKQMWVNMGSCEKVLYIGTEQVAEEIQTMILAYLSDLNEDIILNGTYRGDEESRVQTAAKIMEMYKDNFIISRLPEPNLSEVKTHLRHNCLNNGVEYVFYDYIFATPSLLNEFRDLSIRQDVALRMLSTLLKDLAVELNVFIMSATQITGVVEFKPGYIRNYSLLRDSKSIPDKADFAAIKAKVLPEELNLLNSLCARIGKQPNQVLDVYKMRRGRWTDVRIWSLTDLGTCRTQNLFITDANLNEVDGFEVKHILFDPDDMDGIHDNLALVNNGEVSTRIEEKINNKLNNQNDKWGCFDALI